jgi:hypothetical protein
MGRWGITLSSVYTCIPRSLGFAYSLIYAQYVNIPRSMDLNIALLMHSIPRSMDLNIALFMRR